MKIVLNHDELNFMDRIIKRVYELGLKQRTGIDDAHFRTVAKMKYKFGPAGRVPYVSLGLKERELLTLILEYRAASLKASDSISTDVSSIASLLEKIAVPPKPKKNKEEEENE